MIDGVRRLGSGLEGVERRVPLVHPDARGSFRELWRGHEWSQVNLSISGPTVLRGMHYHRWQTDLWTLLDGDMEVHLVDLRGGVAIAPIAMRLRPTDQIVIPPGVAHGFLTVSGATLLYAVTREYDGTDEYGYAWDDPANGDWAGATVRPLLSERDATAPSLAEVLQHGLYARRPDE